MARQDDYSMNQVKFFTKMVRNEVKSREAEQPVFDEIEYIHILKPGDKNHEIIRPVTDQDKEIYKPIYDRYQEKVAAGEVLDGTALDIFPAADAHDVAVLKNNDILTVEQLADLDEEKANTAGPVIVRLREKAQLFLEHRDAGNAAEVIASQKEQIEGLEAELAEFKEAAAAEIADLKAQLEAAQKGSAKQTAKKPAAAGRSGKGKTAA